MAKALEIFAEEQSHRTGGRGARLAQLRDLLEQLIGKSVSGAIVHGQDVPRLPHTSNISFPNCNRQALLIALDRAGVACSTGSACASGSSERSHVLVAMGCENAVVEGALRFSLGSTSDEDQVRQAVERILGVVWGQKTA
jgi:cysteine desulfurase